MISIYDRATLKAALPIAPELRQLIKARLHKAEQAELIGLTHILVIQPGDTEAEIIREVAFTPLANPIDGARYGTDCFMPFWACFRLTKAGTK